MKVLLDEDLPHDFRLHLSAHEVRTVRYMGWYEFKNGNLIKVAEDSGFQVLVTGDQNLAHQQNLKGRNISFVVLSCQDLPGLVRALPRINRAIERATPGTLQFVACGQECAALEAILRYLACKHLVNAPARCPDNP